MSIEFYNFQNVLTNQNMNTGVFARFYDKVVKTGNFQKNGLPEFEKRLYIEIRVRDERDVFDQPATIEHIQRFAVEYNRYLNQKEKTKKGTALELFSFLSPEQIEACHFRGIFTVEELNKISKENAQSLNLTDEKKLADLFLKKSKHNDLLADFKRKEKEYEDEIEELKQELARYKERSV